MRISRLDDLELHDSVLLKVEANRPRPDGVDGNDEIRLLMLHREYGDASQPVAERLRTLVFAGCRAARLRLNYGFIGEEHIDAGESRADSEWLREVWAKCLPGTPALLHHAIWTANTGSELDIACSAVRLIEGAGAGR